MQEGKYFFQTPSLTPEETNEEFTIFYFVVVLEQHTWEKILKERK